MNSVQMISMLFLTKIWLKMVYLCRKMSENKVGEFWQKMGEFGQKKYAYFDQRGHFRPHWPFHRGSQVRGRFGRSSYGFGKLDGCFSFGHFEIKGARGSKFSSSFDTNFEKWRLCCITYAILWQGWWPCLLRSIPVCAILFTVQAKCSDFLEKIQ